jgi:tRNA (mo5U34)-methyltransferase
LNAASLLQQEIEAVDWFHRIDLGNGMMTPGRVDCASRLPGLGLPDDFHGLTVLDVGAWDGFFSFEAERRGARRVLATDYFSWDGPGWGSKAGFELARRVLGSRVEDREIDVMDLSAEAVGTFDVVLFLNVLYHLRHPLLALERIHSVTADRLILETHVDLLDVDRPAMAFYPGAEMWDDPTTWWGPNVALVQAMLTDVGFSTVEVHSQSSIEQRRARALYLKRIRGVPVEPTLQQGWAVFHAWR